MYLRHVDDPACQMRRLTQRPSQQVHESISPVTPGGHVSIVMERTSTGGTRHQAAMKRKAGAAMSGAERAEKKRRKASLFPAKAATLRENDAERKRKASSDESAQRQGDAVKEAAALLAKPGPTSLGSPAWPNVVGIMNVILVILENAAFCSDELGEGAKANECRQNVARVANAVARIEAPTQQAMRALLPDVYDAWWDVQERVVADREAADQRGESWWRELWSNEGMCEAWQGPLPPYRSIVCTCCSHVPLRSGAKVRYTQGGNVVVYDEGTNCEE